MTIHTKFALNSAAPIIALHSSASSGGQWKHLARHLEGQFELIAPDLPGYGLLDREMNTLELSGNLNGVDAIALPLICNFLRTNQPVHLVGHSYGAAIALKIALMRPDIIKSLTLFEPVAFHLLKDGDLEDRKSYETINLIADILKTSVATERPDLGMMRFIDFWNGKGAWHRCSEKIRAILTGQATSVISDFSRSFSETWKLSDLHRLNIPTLMLMGSKSPSVAKRIATQVAKALPDCNFEIMEGLNHMAPVTSPDLINPLIHQHINEAEEAPAEFNWPILSAS